MPAASVAFPIVGIGASAGGLDAFLQLLKHLPADTGMGFVLIQHLDPQHESALSQLLGRATSMPVQEVTDRLRVQPNHVYVIPPGKQMTIVRGVLKLQPRVRGPGAPQRAIDSFLESLAHDRRERAIGVILSGTATDGTLGLEAIKGEGGITFAQDASAKYLSMPRSAVAAGCVDFELSPFSIARELARVARHPHVAGRVPQLRGEADRTAATTHGRDRSPLPSGGRGTPRTGSRQAHTEAAEDRREGPADNGFKKILLLVRKHAGVDFTLYRSATIQRRITRRMALRRLETIEAYARFLTGNSQELDALYSDMLISVTSFFRNAEAFDVLQKKVFPKLLAQPGDAPVRIWVLGCSTGQEAYSLAMAFTEAAGRAKNARRVQIFATDLNEALLHKARAGLYAKSLAQDLSPERLRRFFVEEEGGYRANKQLRETVVFARQNVLSDPPFSRMDLVSCRNLLIYIEPALQKQILPMFHYALNPGGTLFLGASESVAGFTDLFESLDRKQKLFIRKPALTPPRSAPAAQGKHPADRKIPAERSVAVAAGSLPDEFGAQREADRLMVGQFAPPGVLVNADLQVRQFRGPTSPYLEPPTGRASFDLLKMAREGLMLPLRAALSRAKRGRKPVRKEHVRVRQNGGTRLVTLQVTPLKHGKEPSFLVLFIDERTAGAPADTLATAAARAHPVSARSEARRSQVLEGELIETRDYLQSIQEQHETEHEELQASNEEVTSANEELQSLNEELETSKEELESTNEELTTVNEELAQRNLELDRLNADLNNLHVSINTAILVVNKDLTVRRFTQQAAKAFNLLPADLGRPLASVRHNLELIPAVASLGGRTTATPIVPSLEGLVREVISTLTFRECEAQDRDGRWHVLRMRPYLTLDHKIDGAVIVLVDIDALKRSETEIRRARDYAEAILRTTRTPLLVLRPNLQVNTANAAFYHTFMTAPRETEGRPLANLGNGQWNLPALRHWLEEVLPRNNLSKDFELTHEFPLIGPRTMLLNARRLDDAAGDSAMILLAIEDVTAQRRLDEAIRRSEARFRALILASTQIVWIAGADGGMLEADSASWEAFTGQSFAERRDAGAFEAIHPSDRAGAKKLWAESLAGGHTYQTEYRIRRADGVYRWTAAQAVPVRNADHTIREWVGMNTDISERKAVSRRLRSSLMRYRSLFEASQDGILIIDAATRKITEANPFIAKLLGYERAEIVGRELREIGLLRDETANRAMFRELERTGGLCYDNLPLETKTGERREVEIIATHYEEGSHHVIQCNIRDITARKQVEEARRESEQRYRTLFNSIDEGFCLIEMLFAPSGQPADYRFLEVNPSFEKQSGLRNVVGRTMRELAPGHEKHWFDIFGGVSRSGEPVRFVNEAKELGRWFDVYCFRLSESDHSRVAILFKDITAQRIDSLELTRVRDEAVAASHAKDEFLATLSHELRTPLNPVLLLASNNAADATLPEEIRADFETISNNIGLEARLIDDLLDLTRISSGKLSLEALVCDVHAVLRDAIAIVRADIEGKHLKLSVNLSGSYAGVMGDPMRLQQVFWNLLRNAIHFTPEGGGIVVTTRAGLTDETLVVTITDTGTGIPATELERIFEVFAQAETSPGAPRRAGGLGLGLAISRKMVELHGGTIYAMSPGRDKGATFVIELPLLPRAERAAPPGSTSPLQPPPLRKSPGAANRILLVDDHAPTLGVLRIVLERQGYLVFTARTLAEAAQVASSQKIDVLVSDLGLPDGEGYGLLLQLRADHPRLQGVAMSGYGTADDIARTRAAGYEAHLTKPVEISALNRVLEKFAAAE